jgi:hypothetical protein
MKHGNSSEYNCNTIRTTIRSRPGRTVTMFHTSVRRGRDLMVVLIVLHLYSLVLIVLHLYSLVLIVLHLYSTTMRSRPRRTEV